MAKKNPNIETWYPAPNSLRTQEEKIAHELWLEKHPRPMTKEEFLRSPVAKDNPDYDRLMKEKMKAWDNYPNKVKSTKK